ncbi:hypothetical protein P154DRAFT_535932 [Amniculicola lignicola CBS 123094]|uniref:Uncharacterized protein n=1 Tax=Amniculicola lignicola CBS 123094 TaxID=1392246 RepID=A0A6A5WAY2_9PLEO|nr:hypothetical protein P154DRAFT_535932 [Amniculicola lignicola CBS 123094]
MLSISLFAIAALLSVTTQGATIASINKSPTEIQARGDDATDVGMLWTGPVFKGGPNVSLNGDAESIWNQIIALNPQYDPEDSAMALGLTTGNISARDDLLSKRQSSCNGLEAALSNVIWGAITHLKLLGGYCGAAGGTCARMTCAEDSGTFICAETSANANTPCADTALYIQEIVNRCACPNGLVFGNRYTPGVSYWVGLARCWRGGDERPTDNPLGSQPNHGVKC